MTYSFHVLEILSVSAGVERQKDVNQYIIHSHALPYCYVLMVTVITGKIGVFQFSSLDCE